MFDIGFSELLIFGAIALIVLGPEKLPQTARTVGRWYAKFRRTLSHIQSEIETELDLAETRRKMQEELQKIKQAELEMKQEMEQLKTSLHNLKHQRHSQTSQTTENEPHDALNPQSDNQHLVSLTKQSTTKVKSITEPMYYRWFLLSDYDKKRRLPKAPFLPNYQADKLLSQHSLD